MVVKLNDKNLKFYGRTLFSENGAAFFYSASGVEFNAQINGELKFNFKGEKINTSKSWGIYFNVYINQKLVKRIHILSQTEQEFLIADNLNGEFNVKIVRETEFCHGIAHLSKIDFNGTLLERPKDKELFIEFLGDSITCGYGLLYKGQKTFENSRSSTQSAVRGYAYKTAKLLNADYSLVSQSGIGVYIGYVTEYNMKEIYPYYIKKFSNQKYDFKRQPNIVVINLGTNDIGANYDIHKKEKSEIIKAFKDFLKTIRSYNKKAKIVWCYGMMRDEYNEDIVKIIEEFGGSKKGYYAFHMPRNNEGFRWHPNKKGQADAAKALSEYLKTI